MEKTISDGGRSETRLPARTATVSAITVTTASTAILSENMNRAVAIIQVLSGGPVYVSSGIATVAGGFPLATGSSFEVSSDEPLTGIVASGTADVRVWEESA